jgi:Uma2 family endonuclease
MATATMVGEERVLLDEVSWEAYEALLASWGDRPIRLTYDNGSLEITSPSRNHEKCGRAMGRVVESFTEEMNIPLDSGGSTTFRQKLKKRGLEPDECYWIKNALKMRGRLYFDFKIDPPPDLSIEVDITSSSLDRMSIYASLGMPEIWRFDGETFTINLLQPDGAYADSAQSAALPALPPSAIVRFLEMSAELDETTLIRTFRAWIRETIQAAPPPRTKKRPRRPKK